MAGKASIGVTVTFGSAIGELIDINLSGCAAGTIDTSYQGTTDGWRTHDFSGLIEPGEVTLKVHFDGTLPAIGTVDDLVIAFTPLTATFTWADCILTGFDPSANMATDMTASLKFKLNGKPTIS